MFQLTRFDPFYDLAEEVFKGVAPSRMKVDVAEKNGAYTVTADLPGVKKEDIQITIDGPQLTLAAEVKREKETTDEQRVLHTERVFGRVSRSFTLPQELDEGKAEAKFRDGVLELTLPKKAAAQRKQITIQ